MADLVNPYANPYLPSFVNQRPKINDPSMAPTVAGYQSASFSQIHSVKGFEGAENYNLANGASEILAESDPNMARIYVVAKDANGQMFVQGFNLTPVERPKPVTMDDLSSQMNRILDRLEKLEGERRNDQPVSGNAWKSNSKHSGHAANQPNGRNGQDSQESTNGYGTDVAK